MTSSNAPHQAWPQQPAGNVQLGPSNALAIAALTCGIASMTTLVFGFPGGLVAIVLGIAGLVRSNALPGRRGAGMAKVGIATGVVALVIPALVVVAVTYLGSQATTDLQPVNTDISNSGAGGSTRSDGAMSSDPPDGYCNQERFIEDPDC